MEAEKKTILNEEQSCAAYCDKNAVVAAGAGSGKTMVLASRFAWLVTEKKLRAREILTLTFTKKAAGQMYRRIHRLLADISYNDSGEKKELAANALDDFAQARIQTLDSYCSAIVKQAANRYGVSPDFTIDEDRCYQLARDEALPFLITHRNHPVIKKLYSWKSPVEIANDIFAYALIYFTHVDSPPNPKENFVSQNAVVCAEWESQSGIVLGKLRELAEVYEGNEKFLPDLAPLISRFSSGGIAFPEPRELRAFFNGLAACPGQSAIEWAESQTVVEEMAGALRFISSLCSLGLNRGTRQNPAKEIIKELRVLSGKFSSLGIFCMQAGLIYSFLLLLSDLQLSYLARKRSEGLLTFHDVARLARKILVEQHDIRQSEKESFKAIMIDEFQDNNELQKDLLFLLAEREDVSNNSVPETKDLYADKLFFVGDEKQSIYRFRGADVSVFRKLKDELACEDLPLRINYRSSPSLIGAFNAIFGGSVFDPEGNSPPGKYPAVFAPGESGDESLPSYEASFSPLKAFKTSEGKLTLCILDKKDVPDEESAQLSPVESEARFVTEQINALLKEKDESGKLKYRPHDIAILFRTRSNQHLFEKHLMLLNIPYASEDLNGFFYGGPVNDLMSVLRLAAYPTDRAAYAQMLRSPFAGLSLSALSICINALDSPGASSESKPFDDNPLPLLPEPDRTKYLHGQKVYQNIISKAETETICSLLNELWYSEGYRYETEWNPVTAAYRELYDYLFHLAAGADEGNQTLAVFTDNILSLSKSGERLSDLEIPLERPSAVNLLTIHKSKGLEFKVVFLCCCDKKGRNDYSDDIFETDENFLTLNPPLPQSCADLGYVKRSFFWELSAALERGKRIAELRRLLYVGMTRAENELILSGCLDIGCENDEEFSLSLKRFIENKTAKADEKRIIAGDTILEDDTFFGLCLSAFCAHIPEEGLEGKPSFFDLKKIPIYSEDYIHAAEQQGSAFSNDQAGLDSFFERAEPFYKSAEIIETKPVPAKRFTPTSLPHETRPEIKTGTDALFKGDGAEDIFAGVDKLLERYAKSLGDESEKFDQRSFGTLAHLCVEALFSGREAAIPPKFAGSLTPDDAAVFLEAGKELAARFARSPLGIKARESKNRKSEFPFRTLTYGPDGNEIFINGTIDLFFEDEETFYVVDFKTDSFEQPEAHITQMACYHRAVSELSMSLSNQRFVDEVPGVLFAAPSAKACRVWLYYLRSGHAVEVSGFSCYQR